MSKRQEIMRYARALEKKNATNIDVVKNQLPGWEQVRAKAVKTQRPAALGARKKPDEYPSPYYAKNREKICAALRAKKRAMSVPEHERYKTYLRKYQYKKRYGEMWECQEALMTLKSALNHKGKK